MRPTRRHLLAAPLALPDLARAQRAFPSRPITIIAAGATGGPTDTITRILADSMGRQLDQPVVVESSGGSVVGPQRMVQSKPDGYTLLINNIGMACKRHAVPQAALRHPRQLRLARPGLRRRHDHRDPPGLSGGEPGRRHGLAEGDGRSTEHGAAGLGSAANLRALLVQHAAGAQATIVVFRGTAPAIAELLAGRLDLLCDQATNTIP